MALDAHQSFSPPAARAEAVEELCDGFAHDSRNPLHAMVIHLEVLSDKLKREYGDVPAHMQKNLKSIRDQVDRLDDIVRQFVEIAAPRRQSAPDFDGSALTRSVIGLCTHRARILRADLHAEIQDGIRIVGNASDLAVPLTLSIRTQLESGVRRLRIHLRREGSMHCLELEGGIIAPESEASRSFAHLAEKWGGHFEPTVRGLSLIWPNGALDAVNPRPASTRQSQEQLG